MSELFLRIHSDRRLGIYKDSNDLPPPPTTLDPHPYARFRQASVVIAHDLLQCSFEKLAMSEHTYKFDVKVHPVHCSLRGRR